VNDGEPEPCAFVERAAERLEKPVQFRWRNPASLVANRDRQLLDATFLLYLRGHEQTAAGGHRSEAVGRQVPENLPDLILVGVKPDRLRR
jgi:hypothetical protein